MRLAGDVQRRDTVSVVYDLNVMPSYLSAPSGLYSFEESFLRGKTPGIALRGRGSFCIAVIALGGRKDAFRKSRRPRHRFSDAINFNYVDAGRDDHFR